YGLAASQLQRIRNKEIELTICVDEVAASGGYMMACIANRVLAAPFALLGSIGVVAQIPNFHRLLQKNDIDYEVLTAGEYKRTLTVFGENTDKAREKFVDDLEDVHALFKEFVKEHRPTVDIEEVATGEAWFGRRALEHRLVDELKTSDEYIIERCDEMDVFHIRYVIHKHRLERFMDKVASIAAPKAVLNKELIH
ncbi:MAG: protease SohB, partial [Pseudomonadales bacterium]